MVEIDYINYYLKKDQEDYRTEHIILFALNKIYNIKPDNKDLIKNKDFNRLIIISYININNRIIPLSVLFLLINQQTNISIKDINLRLISKIIDFKITENLEDLRGKRKSIIYNTLLKLKLFFENNNIFSKIIFSNNLDTYNKLKFTKISNTECLLNLEESIDNIFSIGEVIGINNLEKQIIVPKKITKKIENHCFLVTDLIDDNETIISEQKLTEWYSKYDILDSVSFIEDEEVFWVKNIKYDISNKNYLYLLNNDDYIDEILLEKSY
jgi:hypothetical protein